MLSGRAGLSVFTFILTLLAPQPGSGFPWENYAPGTIAQIVSVHEDARDGNALLINTTDEKYRVTVTYVGDKRPIQQPTRRLITEWVKAVGLDNALISWFKHEIHVLEGTKAYWLPVQEVLLPDLAKELSSGDAVELYIMWIGYTGTDWVFLINEFQQVTGAV